MRINELRNIIREEIIQEFKMDKSIQSKVNEFGELSDEIDRVKSHLEGLKKEYKELETQLRPVLEELNEFEQKSIETQKYLVRIKRMGYERESYKYKDVFETSLTKVNRQTRKLLKDLLEDTKSITNVVSSIGVQPIGEGNFLTDLFRKLKKLIRGLVPSIRKTTNKVDDLQSITQKIVGRRL